MSYDERGNRTQLTDPRGNVTGADPADFTSSFVYDVLGRVITETGPPVEVEANGATPVTSQPLTTTGYDTYGNQTHREDPRGHRTTQSFDRLSRRTEIRHPDYTTPDSTVVTATETFAYDQVGNLVAATETRAVQQDRGQDRQRTVPIEGRLVPVPPQWDEWTNAQRMAWVESADANLRPNLPRELVSELGGLSKDFRRGQENAAVALLDAFVLHPLEGVTNLLLADMEDRLGPLPGGRRIELPRVSLGIGPIHTAGPGDAEAYAVAYTGAVVSSAGAGLGGIVRAVGSRLGLQSSFLLGTRGAAAAAVSGTPRTPAIKPGAAGGSTARQRFPSRIREAALEENVAEFGKPTCVFCGKRTDAPQIDHAVPRMRGGNATLENAQVTCPWCNASKGARDLPANPPPGYRGPRPPSWWGSQ